MRAILCQQEMSTLEIRAERGAVLFRQRASLRPRESECEDNIEVLSLEPRGEPNYFGERSVRIANRNTQVDVSPPETRHERFLVNGSRF